MKRPRNTRPLGPVVDDATLSWLIASVAHAFVTLHDVSTELQALRDPAYRPSIGFLGGAPQVSPRDLANAKGVGDPASRLAMLARKEQRRLARERREDAEREARREREQRKVLAAARRDSARTAARRRGKA